MYEITGERCRGPMRQYHVLMQIFTIGLFSQLLYDMETVPMASSHMKKREGTWMHMCR